MVRKYFVQQLGLLLMVSVIIILTNVIGYKMPVKDSIIGVLLLSAISLIGLTISKFMSRFVKLPSMMYVSLLGLLLACPVSPVKDIVVGTTSSVAFFLFQSKKLCCTVTEYRSQHDLPTKRRSLP